ARVALSEILKTYPVLRHRTPCNGVARIGQGSKRRLLFAVLGVCIPASALSPRAGRRVRYSCVLSVLTAGGSCVTMRLQAPNERRHRTDPMPTSKPSPADSHDLIRVRGARQNNLKDVNVDIPKRRLTVFTGVSGSGKSSLVFGTIAAESQRLINETYSTFIQTFMPTLARPEVDGLLGITAAIIVDQERMTANARSTVGTVTDVGALLRILYSRLSVPHVGSSNAFSFNVPSVSGKGAFTVAGKEGKPQTATFEVTGGMCPACEGRGQVS